MCRVSGKSHLIEIEFESQVQHFLIKLSHYKRLKREVDEKPALFTHKDLNTHPYSEPTRDDILRSHIGQWCGKYCLLLLSSPDVFTVK